MKPMENWCKICGNFKKDMSEHFQVCKACEGFYVREKAYRTLFNKALFAGWKLDCYELDGQRFSNIDCYREVWEYSAKKLIDDFNKDYQIFAYYDKLLEISQCPNLTNPRSVELMNELSMKEKENENNT